MVDTAVASNGEANGNGAHATTTAPLKNINDLVVPTDAPAEAVEPPTNEPTSAPAGTLKKLEDLVVPADAPDASNNAGEGEDKGVQPIIEEVGEGQGKDDGEESDEYDFEEEHQAAENEGNEYVVGEEEEEDDEDDEDYEDEEGVGATGQQKPSLTALLLGDPNAAEEIDEDDYLEGAEEEADEEDEGADHMEESTPITPTSKKRGIEETVDEDGEDEELVGAKKVKS